MNSLIALLIAAPSGGVVGAIIVALTNRFKNRADGQLSQVQAAKVAQGMALDMVEPLKADIDELRAENRTLRERVSCLERKDRLRDRHNKMLVEHIEQGKPPPAPRPPVELSR